MSFLTIVGVFAVAIAARAVGYSFNSGWKMFCSEIHRREMVLRGLLSGEVISALAGFSLLDF